MIVKMIQDLGKTKEQTIMNDTINEIKNSLEGINSRITEAEEQIRDLEDKIVEITTAEQNKEKEKKGDGGGAMCPCSALWRQRTCRLGV